MLATVFEGENPLQAVLTFLNAGGPVVYALLVLAVVLWTLILERLMYYRWQMPTDVRQCMDDWQSRPDHHSWQAHKIKQRRVSEAQRHWRARLPLIKALVALCPMMGLLGTVTGMIHVFHVMAVLGTGNARAMAAGISAATLPTMAGMVIAISGLYFVSRLEQRVQRARHHLHDQMVTY